MCNIFMSNFRKKISKLQKAQNLAGRVVNDLLSSVLQLTYSPPAAPGIGFNLPNWLAYVHPCMPVIPLVPSDSATLISSLLRSSAHHLALAASALQPLKSGTLFLYLSVPVPVLIPSVVTSRPTT